MRIEATNVIVGVVAGVADTGLIALDERQGWAESYKNSREWGRIGLCLIGYLGQALNFYPRAMSALAQSEITLVTKSAADLIRTRVISGTMVSHAPVRRTSPGGRVLQKPIGQTTKPGFEEVEIY